MPSCTSRRSRKRNKSLKKEVKWLESKLFKSRANVEAQLSTEKKKYEEKLEATKVATIEAFCSSTAFRDIKVKFGSLSYMQGAEDFKEKVRNRFPDLNLSLLESNDEEVGEVGDDGLQVEDLLKLAHEDPMT